MKLLILDVDGVLTNGTKAYNLDGEMVYKSFYDKDFTAIERFKEDGIKVCWLSADKRVNEKLAESRDIDFWYGRLEDGENGHIDKSQILPKMLAQYEVNLSDVWYVGDDIYDLSIMEVVKNGGGRIFCPLDAAIEVLHISQIIPVNGGEGIVKYLYDGASRGKI